MERLAATSLRSAVPVMQVRIYKVDLTCCAANPSSKARRESGQRLMKLKHTRHHTVSSMVRNTPAPDVVSREDVEPANTGRGEETSSSSDLEGVSRVIYIGQLPHGFYEEQLKGAAPARTAITVPYAAAI